MKIPKKIKIAGYNYDIKMIKDRGKEQGSENPASIYTRHQVIWIDVNQAKEQQESSLFHEIIEAIDFIYELKLEHNKISCLETGLYQVLKDNKFIK